MLNKESLNKNKNNCVAFVIDDKEDEDDCNNGRATFLTPILFARLKKKKSQEL